MCQLHLNYITTLPCKTITIYIYIYENYNFHHSANNVIIIRVLSKKFAWNIIIFVVTVLHGSVVQCIIKVQWIHCIAEILHTVWWGIIFWAATLYIMILSISDACSHLVSHSELTPYYVACATGWAHYVTTPCHQENQRYIAHCNATRGGPRHSHSYMHRKFCEVFCSWDMVSYRQTDRHAYHNTPFRHTGRGNNT